ncbi:DUF2157 domain-containing protein [Thalassobacillus sp. CUG 92003]|uniref:DUF2157 domain-containing protein n=1 Tax=Thalassobacillus sp. CUG 92003 TaxID=2736641 RepID=UPI0015E6464D|nr:DUF2157 domain-containing protein [Thalassobacillus sp. CUG 92003]
MNRERMAKEARTWLEAEIITQEQYQQILQRYPEQKTKPVLLTFAAIFIGLGFLTFIASNWDLLDNVVRLIIILVAMASFYTAGERVYTKSSNIVGNSLLVVAVLIFGSGIFLTGQMYHVSSFSALPFLIWSLAAFAVYVMFQNVIMFGLVMTIVTAGQLYSAMTYQAFYPWLGALLVLGGSYALYRHRHQAFALIVTVSYVVQSVVWTFSESSAYYWLIVLLLLLYAVSVWLENERVARPMRSGSVTAIAFTAVIQVFALEDGFSAPALEDTYVFFLVWLGIMAGVLVKLWKQNRLFRGVDLFLFVPVFLLPWAGAASLMLLFLYALGWLLIGYQQENSQRVTKGTLAFVVSTFIAYIHFAWDFLDKSVFFFVGGVLLFGISYVLERKRRSVQRGGDER